LSTVFIGTSEFAAAVLERLARSDAHRPALVLTRPDRPSGRGRRVSSPPVAEHARSLAIPLEQPPSVNDPQTLESIARAAGSAGTVIVCAFGALIKEPLLSEHEILNVHPSLLPRWRGAAPIERAIMAGDERTGVSIMRLTAGLDSGPVCLAGAEPIRAEDSYGSLSARLQELGGELLVRALEQTPPFVEQPEEGVTYAEKLGPADRLLDPSRDALELERVVRALHPHIGARVELGDGSLLGVHRAALADGEEPTGRDELAGSVGDVARGPVARDGRLLLDCTPGALELLVVQPPGGRAMDAAAYLRGHTPFGGAP
jgi:methionyl-tRNA formyltransferase